MYCIVLYCTLHHESTDRTKDIDTGVSLTRTPCLMKSIGGLVTTINLKTERKKKGEKKKIGVKEKLKASGTEKSSAKRETKEMRDLLTPRSINRENKLKSINREKVNGHKGSQQRSDMVQWLVSTQVGCFGVTYSRNSYCSPHAWPDLRPPFPSPPPFPPTPSPLPSLPEPSASGYRGRKN